MISGQILFFNRSTQMSIMLYSKSVFVLFDVKTLKISFRSSLHEKKAIQLELLRFERSCRIGITSDRF